MKKTVLITGANRGIGLEFSKQYKEQGLEVFAVCREASDELRALDVNIFENIDVTSDASLTALRDKLSGVTINILINNAGIFLNETLDQMDFSQITKQYEVNTLAPLKVAMALLPRLDKGSKMAFVSSRMGSIEDNTSGSYYGYRMSKAGLNALGKSLAMDLKDEEIAVILLHPGYVKTKMTGFNGDITPDVAASGLIKRIDELNIETTGCFMHSDGSELEW